MLRSLLSGALVCALAAPGALAQVPETSALPPTIDLLPPELPWSGRSQELALDPAHEWATPCERSGLWQSPDYDSTVAWLRRLVAATDALEMVSLGPSPEGREIWAVIASAEGAFTPQALRASERPLVLAHSGIHSGEIDGKDAGMMLLRDMTVLGIRADLLDRVNLVFVPIFSVDAHERRSIHARMNQRGPEVMGWRTTARNLNLNRDYVKAEAVEMRHMLRALRDYEPDLYLDLHVTDGADYQYDITYGFNGPHGWSPAIATWLQERWRPEVDAALEEMGHVPGPLIFAVDQRDISKGIYDWTASPRFSHGYGDARHLPTVLLENHSLKPYPQRVLGTYVFLEASLRAVSEHQASLLEAVARDRTARPPQVHLAYRAADEVPPTMLFKAVRAVEELSPITGQPVVRYTGKPYEVEVPRIGNRERAAIVERPQAYLLPAAWADLAELLERHGILTDQLQQGGWFEVERYRLPEAELADQPFEGRARVEVGEPVVERERVWFHAGAIRVDTDQSLGTLAMLMLEPRSEDSLLQWGYFLEILQRTEYFESYVMEPLARRMMEEDPALARRFGEALRSDPGLAGDARARLEWFYVQTPFHDAEHLLYPVARLVD